MQIIELASNVAFVKLFAFIFRLKVDLKKLAIITTHPIQYNAPWFRLLAQRGKLGIKIFYTWGQLAIQKKYDPGFEKNVEWDIPLLDGYDYTFVENISKEPGSHHFNGIDNPTLINEIEKWNPDALLVFGWSFKSHLKVLKYFKGKKTILFRGDSHLLDQDRESLLKKMLRPIFLKWVYQHVDKALYAGDANRIYFRYAGMKDQQLVFAPHAIDNERFCKGGKGQRTVLEIPEEAIVFLFAGKLEEKKNPMMLLEAFIALNDPDTHLLFAGDGVLGTPLKKLVKGTEEAVQKRIHFVGFQNQSAMPGIYKSADILVLPSRGPGETWGLSVNEAMVAGCAVLVSDRCGCHSDLVKEGVNGFVFRSNDVKQLTFLMGKIANEKNELQQRRKASKTIIKDFSFEKICKAIEEVMD